MKKFYNSYFNHIICKKKKKEKETTQYIQISCHKIYNTGTQPFHLITTLKVIFPCLFTEIHWYTRFCTNAWYYLNTQNIQKRLLNVCLNITILNQEYETYSQHTHWSSIFIKFSLKGRHVLINSMEMSFLLDNDHRMSPLFYISGLFVKLL